MSLMALWSFMERSYRRKRAIIGWGRGSIILSFWKLKGWYKYYVDRLTLNCLEKKVKSIAFLFIGFKSINVSWKDSRIFFPWTKWFRECGWINLNWLKLVPLRHKMHKLGKTFTRWAIETTFTLFFFFVCFFPGGGGYSHIWLNGDVPL